MPVTTRSARSCNLPSTATPSNSFPHYQTTPKPSAPSAGPDQASSRSRLLSLPAEILQMILRRLLLSPGPLAPTRKRLRRLKERPRNDDIFGKWQYEKASFDVHPQVLRVCHHLHKAGWHILYKQNSWLFQICHTRYANLEFVAVRPDGTVTTSDDTFIYEYASAPPPLAAAVMKMEKFNFDVQLESCFYRGMSHSEDYFEQLPDELRDILTGSEKEITFNLTIPTQHKGKVIVDLDDQFISDLAKFFGVFKGVRCSDVGVFVNGVQKNTALAEVMMSDQSVDETLPEKFEAYEEYIDQYIERDGFPDEWHERVKQAVIEWSAEELHKCSDMVLEVVDAMLENEREQLE